MSVHRPLENTIAPETAAAHAFGHEGSAPGMEGSMLVYPKAAWIVVGLSNLSASTTGSIVQFIGNRVPLSPA